MAAALLALAACDKPAVRPAPLAPPPPVVAPPVAVAAPVNPAITIQTFTCAGGGVLQAGYPDKDTAVVIWKDHAYTLKQAQSGSGVRYTGYGLQWWSKGFTQGSIATLKEGEEIASAPGLECFAPEPGAVTPPEPGTPGGLPDDKTPISEAPFTPTSAQGAANVVQTYYALIGERRSADAAPLRVDGIAENLSAYTSYHAQVGAPGKIEGAAGSLMVQVPIAVYGRLSTGAEFKKAGKVTLRRVNDVPGATPEQLKWRIDRIDLKP